MRLLIDVRRQLRILNFKQAHVVARFVNLACQIFLHFHFAYGSRCNRQTHHANKRQRNKHTRNHARHQNKRCSSYRFCGTALCCNKVYRRSVKALFLLIIRHFIGICAFGNSHAFHLSPLPTNLQTALQTCYVHYAQLSAHRLQTRNFALRERAFSRTSSSLAPSAFLVRISTSGFLPHVQIPSSTGHVQRCDHS